MPAAGCEKERSGSGGILQGWCRVWALLLEVSFSAERTEGVMGSGTVERNKIPALQSREVGILLRKDFCILVVAPEL